MSQYEYELWQEINQNIRDLVENENYQDVKVCTGPLYRSNKEKIDHEEMRKSKGFYNFGLYERRPKVGQSKDTMTYEILAGFAVPHALYKAFTYRDKSTGREYLSMFVVPYHGREESIEPNPQVFNHFWSSLHKLERVAGTYIFQLELNRLNSNYRNFVEESCQPRFEVYNTPTPLYQAGQENKDRDKTIPLQEHLRKTKGRCFDLDNFALTM
uniref:DNA/RNA non-specific endonuclease domain-containing protein n=1 Tax=Romanomermis culicivorax TaxID=13658 RepID=A0A915K9M3_ROMCU